jgi:hypothetical protein
MRLPTDVFICYSRKNSRFVDQLVRDLEDHQITVWLDRIELEPGDTPRRKIEEAIDACQFFCFVISEAALNSFYARKLELEAAFTKMINTGREGFILPILREKPSKPLPLMLGSLHYLDCTTNMKYKENLKRLVKKVKLEDENFTGARIYKNLDTSFSGHMVGVGPIRQIPHHGAAVRLYFHNGRVRTMETFTDGVPDGAKSVIYEAQMRVHEIVLFRNNRVVDTWKYEYDSVTGLRCKKYVYRPGQNPHLEMTYDKHGNRTSERHLNPDGTLDDSQGFAVQEWLFNDKGEPVTERFLDKYGSVVKKQVRTATKRNKT